ncbi:MAG TPA: hypothetical protein VFF94_17150, partial [Novosphingobium sp.]|nr:hypothetical protein [Novosphingobium sp.]
MEEPQADEAQALARIERALARLDAAAKQAWAMQRLARVEARAAQARHGALRACLGETLEDLDRLLAAYAPLAP